MPEESILRWRQVAARTGLSRPTIWRAVRAGSFPTPVSLLPGDRRTVGWLASEVDAWIADRVKQRDDRRPVSAQKCDRPRKAASENQPQT
jgi:prophage regulatory protein